jgi:hypothetical protein
MAYLFLLHIVKVIPRIKKCSVMISANFSLEFVYVSTNDRLELSIRDGLLWRDVGMYPLTNFTTIYSAIKSSLKPTFTAAYERSQCASVNAAYRSTFIATHGLS